LGAPDDGHFAAAFRTASNIHHAGTRPTIITDMIIVPPGQNTLPLH
jgi:hypothetical protein